MKHLIEFLIVFFFNQVCVFWGDFTDQLIGYCIDTQVIISINSAWWLSVDSLTQRQHNEASKQTQKKSQDIWIVEKFEYFMNTSGGFRNFHYKCIWRGDYDTNHPRKLYKLLNATPSHLHLRGKLGTVGFFYDGYFFCGWHRRLDLWPLLSDLIFCILRYLHNNTNILVKKYISIIMIWRLRTDYFQIICALAIWCSWVYKKQKIPTKIGINFEEEKIRMPKLPSDHHQHRKNRNITVISLEFLTKTAISATATNRISNGQSRIHTKAAISDQSDENCDCLDQHGKICW